MTGRPHPLLGRRHGRLHRRAALDESVRNLEARWDAYERALALTWAARECAAHGQRALPGLGETSGRWLRRAEHAAQAADHWAQRALDAPGELPGTEIVANAVPAVRELDASGELARLSLLAVRQSPGPKQLIERREVLLPEIDYRCIELGHLHRSVLFQDQFWWDRWGLPHRLEAMTTPYLVAVLEFLCARSQYYWRRGSADLVCKLCAAVPHDARPKRGEYLSAGDWLRDTPLLIAIRGVLAERGQTSPPAP